MKTPAFWRASPQDPRARLLAPIGWLVGAIAARRLRRSGADLSVPSLLVGNFIVGGAGKTPAVIAFASLLRSMGERPAIVARGYGGSHKAPMRVEGQSFRIVGDEALLLARAAPTFVGVDRMRAARLAIEEARPSVLLFDDGLQSRRIAPTAACVAADAAIGFGNGRCLPAGPLRAPLERQWPLASALILIGEGRAGEAAADAARARGLPIFRARMRLRWRNQIAPRFSLPGERLAAFAGIGYPEKFFSSLKAAGADLRGARAFADHHIYSAAEIEALSHWAAQCGARLATTEKDFVRLPPLPALSPAPEAIGADLIFEDEGAAREFLRERLFRA